MTLREAMAFLGSTQTENAFRRWVYRNRIPHGKFGNQLFFSRTALAALGRTHARGRVR